MQSPRLDSTMAAMSVRRPDGQVRRALMGGLPDGSSELLEEM